MSTARVCGAAVAVPSSSLSDLVSFAGTHSVNGSLSIDALATGCSIKKLYVSKRYANRIKRHLHGVLFVSFFSFFHFSSLSELSPANY